MSLNWMIKRLVERVPSGVLLLVLDACRDNAADSTFKGGAGGGAGAASGGLSAPVVGASSVRRDRCRLHCPRLRDHHPYFTQPVLLLHLFAASSAVPALPCSNRHTPLLLLPNLLHPLHAGDNLVAHLGLGFPRPLVWA